MWLVNTDTIRLHYFVDSDIPKYSILSHRWEDEEISFANLRDCQMVDDGLSKTMEDEEQIFPAMAELRRYRLEKLKSMNGWGKLRSFCNKSRRHEFEWAWIDTVCIDKSSSSEVQEAINSMFEWYRNAAQCFVYMYDVTSDPVKTLENCRNEFRQSSWFTRGWTLQELLAPVFSSIAFFNRDWDLIGFDEDLINEIVSVTGIPKRILETGRPTPRRLEINSCSLAQRFSWAAARQVTRGEDAAYSLLGLFNIHMPMLYGEGRFKAFERLQLEILKVSRDETILAWNIGSTAEFNKRYEDNEISYLLAKSPQEFAGLGALQKRVFQADKKQVRGNPHQMTQTGLLMEAILIDKESKLVPSALRNAKDWTLRFALPLFVQTNRYQLHKNGTETVIVQLEHWNGNEYLRPNANFVAKLDWDELQKRHKPQRFFICSSTYFFSFE